MVSEARLVATDSGFVPNGDGWFVVNARDARWWHSVELGSYCPFEGESRFGELGINLTVLQPGQPNCMYHGENIQEDFLVLSGECVVIIEGQERRLKQWDFVHCPAWTEHVFVGAGSGPCALLATGARHQDGEVLYPRSEVALAHQAGVSEATSKPAEAYARFAEPEAGVYRDGDLPG